MGQSFAVTHSGAHAPPTHTRLAGQSLACTHVATAPLSTLSGRNPDVSSAGSAHTPPTHDSSSRQSRSFTHTSRHCRSTPQTSVPGQSLLRTQDVSAGLRQTLAGLSLSTQRVPGTGWQSADVSQATWQVWKAHTSGEVQSLFKTHPCASSARVSAFALEEQAATTAAPTARPAATHARAYGRARPFTPRGILEW